MNRVSLDIRSPEIRLFERITKIVAFVNYTTSFDGRT